MSCFMSLHKPMQTDCPVDPQDQYDWDLNYIMAGCVFVVAKEVFYHGNGSILTLWWWLNNERQFFWCKFSCMNNQLYLVRTFNHLKSRYTEPCNFLTKRALVSQPSTLVFAKDSNISHYLNLSMYLTTIILAITHSTLLYLTNELKFDD